MLIFCSRGYFQSKNCMRELRSAATLRKPLLAVLEPDPAKGLHEYEIREQLLEGWRDEHGFHSVEKSYEKWGFNEAPSRLQLLNALFTSEPIEWNRLRQFQDVTMRLIAEAMLPPDLHGATYLEGEIAHEVSIRLPPPRGVGRTQHIYCSPHVPGGVSLIYEVAAAFGLSVQVTSTFNELLQCESMLVYLTGRTWTSGEASAAFAVEVECAMDANVPLLLAHEMPGVSGQIARHGVEFGTFFSCPDGATPSELLQRGVYSSIAVALKGGPMRQVSMVLLAQALAMPPPDVAFGRASRASAARVSASRESRLSRLTRLSTEKKEDIDRGTVRAQSAPAEAAQAEMAGGRTSVGGAGGAGGIGATAGPIAEALARTSLDWGDNVAPARRGLYYFHPQRLPSPQLGIVPNGDGPAPDRTNAVRSRLSAAFGTRRSESTEGSPTPAAAARTERSNVMRETENDKRKPFAPYLVVRTNEKKERLRI